jgi:protein-disulfide isomerase
MTYHRPAVIHMLAIGLAVVATACGGNSSEPTGVGPSATAQLPDLAVMLAEKTLGSPTAPVTMIEYSSLTCSHCASFHAETLPQIKTAYIDTGKVRLVYRDFPLDTTAMSAAMVAHCSGDRYFTVIELLFRTQASWVSSNPTAAIKTVVAQVGMTGADVDSCLALTGVQYGVNGTPTFIIGSQTIVGAWPFATFDAVLKSLTQ